MEHPNKLINSNIIALMSFYKLDPSLDTDFKLLSELDASYDLSPRGSRDFSEFLQKYFRQHQDVPYEDIVVALSDMSAVDMLSIVLNANNVYYDINDWLATNDEAHIIDAYLPLVAERAINRAYADFSAIKVATNDEVFTLLVKDFMKHLDIYIEKSSEHDSYTLGVEPTKYKYTYLLNDLMKYFKDRPKQFLAISDIALGYGYYRNLKDSLAESRRLEETIRGDRYYDSLRN